MSETNLTIKSENTVRIHGSDFEVIVHGNGNVNLFFGDKYEPINWIVERRKEREKESQ